MAKINYRIEMRGHKELQKALDRLADVGGFATPVMGKWVVLEAQRLRAKKYPPKRPGQTYIRTQTLGDSWRGEERGDLEVAIVNPAEQKQGYYANYVVGEKQAEVHRGRWWRGQDTIEEDGLPKLIEMLEAEIDEVWDE